MIHHLYSFQPLKYCLEAGKADAGRKQSIHEVKRQQPEFEDCALKAARPNAGQEPDDMTTYQAGSGLKPGRRRLYFVSNGFAAASATTPVSV
jgi:hypothetical protein